MEVKYQFLPNLRTYVRLIHRLFVYQMDKQTRRQKIILLLRSRFFVDQRNQMFLQFYHRVRQGGEIRLVRVYKQDVRYTIG